MFTVDLEKSLVKRKSALLSKDEDLLKRRVQADLDVIDPKDMQVFTNLGMDHSFKAFSELKQKENRVSQWPQERLFDEADIKKLCIAYRLRCLSTEYYHGEMCPQLPKKIREFEKTYGFRLTERNCRIVAPKSSFNLQERPFDPLFFVMVGDNKFYLLHKWGKDLTMWRWIVGLPVRSVFNFAATFILTGMAIGIACRTVQDVFMSGLVGGAMGLGVAVMVGLTAGTFFEDIDMSDSNWNSEFRSNGGFYG